MNPIIYMVNAFRYGFLGISDVPLGTAYLIIIGFIVALYGLAWWLISRGTGCATDRMQRAPWGARFCRRFFLSCAGPSRIGSITALLSRFYLAPCDPPQFSDYPQRYNSSGWKVCTMEALRLFFSHQGRIAYVTDHRVASHFRQFSDARRQGFLAVMALRSDRSPGRHLLHLHAAGGGDGRRRRGRIALFHQRRDHRGGRKDLPRNLCPLIKSSYGFGKTDKCPYFYFSDLVVGKPPATARRRCTSTWPSSNRCT